MAELRNVLVFTVGAQRYAIELRWVREVVRLGFVTDVPTAPTALAGICNRHGEIIPVLDLGVLVGHAPAVPARQGDGALVIEVGELVCALRVDQVDQVASLHESGGELHDGAGRLALLDPSHVIRNALEALSGHAERAP